MLELKRIVLLFTFCFCCLVGDAIVYLFPLIFVVFSRKKKTDLLLVNVFVNCSEITIEIVSYNHIRTTWTKYFYENILLRPKNNFFTICWVKLNRGLRLNPNGNENVKYAQTSELDLYFCWESRIIFSVILIVNPIKPSVLGA